MERHIAEGKEELNFSEFGDYSGRRKKNKLKSTVKQVEQEKMPISSYTLIHPNAELSEEEKKMIVQWMDELID